MPSRSLSARRPRVPAAVRPVLALGLTAAVLGGWLPRAAGTSWPEIGAALGAAHHGLVVVAATLWLFGHWVQTVAQRAALPALTLPRALMLNTSGCALSTLAPMGGALGVGVLWRRVRAWGVGADGFAGYVLVLQLCALVGKLVLPLLAVALLLGAGLPLGPLPALAATAVGLLLIVGSLAHERAARRADLMLVGAANRLRSWRGLPSGSQAGDRVRTARGTALGLLRTQGARLSVTTLVQLLVQVSVLGASLYAVGARPALAAVVAALAVERTATLLVFLPAGVGVAEVGAIAVLVALGVPPQLAAAGILLPRLFVLGLEVPVGVTVLAVWAVRPARPARPAPVHQAVPSIPEQRQARRRAWVPATEAELAA